MYKNFWDIHATRTDQRKVFLGDLFLTVFGEF